MGSSPYHGERLYKPARGGAPESFVYILWKYLKFSTGNGSTLNGMVRSCLAVWSRSWDPNWIECSNDFHTSRFYLGAITFLHERNLHHLRMRYTLARIRFILHWMRTYSKYTVCGFFLHFKCVLWMKQIIQLIVFTGVLFGLDSFGLAIVALEGGCTFPTVSSDRIRSPFRHRRLPVGRRNRPPEVAGRCSSFRHYHFHRKTFNSYG